MNPTRVPFQMDLTVSGEEVMSEGFQGAAIGKEVERRETEKFRRRV